MTLPVPVPAQRPADGVGAGATANRARAVALAYRDGDAAPRVTAKGTGLVAEEIIRRAREAGVFVHESAELVGLLARVDLDAHIPPQLYLAIAEILAWIYRVEQAAAAGAPPPPPPRRRG
jgi:flagellar biosynthesis protein